jgi:hypothetical protein
MIEGNTSVSVNSCCSLAGDPSWIENNCSINMEYLKSEELCLDCSEVRKFHLITLKQEL